MTRILAKLTVLILLLPFILGSASDAPPARAKSLAENNTAFALALYGRLKAAPGNLFFSPYSVSTALAMTYAGARGDTGKQMARILHFDQGKEQIHSSFGELQRQLNEAGGRKGIELNVANALWAQNGHPFLPSFLAVATGDYQAGVNHTDFKTGAEAARGEINHWVAQKTKDRIKDILPPRSLSALTRLVLVNAIYFKGVWTRPYDKAQTSDQPFHRSTASQMDVPLMHHLDDVRYMENGDFQAVELPYRGGELSMVVLLPRQVDACGELENRLTPALLADALSQMKQQKIEIFLPRFRLESSFNLSDTLAGMGMSDAFSAKADFSGIDGTRDLFISCVFHKAWGEVNEEGSEAAAATAVAVDAMAVRRPPPPPPVFRADHPFLFLIRDTASGSILFLGRLADPAR